MSRDPQLNHTSFSLLISCNKNISAQIKKFKDLHLKIMGLSERKIFSTLLPALTQVCTVRLCLLGVLLCQHLPIRDFEVCALIYSRIWQIPCAGLAGGGTGWVWGNSPQSQEIGIGKCPIQPCCSCASCWESSQPFPSQHMGIPLGNGSFIPNWRGAGP